MCELRNRERGVGLRMLLGSFRMLLSVLLVLDQGFKALRVLGSLGLKALGL